MGCFTTSGSNLVRPVKVGPVGGSTFEGPIKDRRCTDVLFIIVFLAFLGALTYVVYNACSKGNPTLLFYGTDSWGNICGQENDNIDGVALSGQDTRAMKKLFYFSVDQLLSSSVSATPVYTSNAICVAMCPDNINDIAAMESFANIQRSKLCRYDQHVQGYFSGNTDGTDNCPEVPISKTSSLFNRCVPDSIASTINRIGESLTNLLDKIDDNFSQKSAEDMENCWLEVIYLILISIGLSLVMVLLMRFVAAVIIWSIVIIMALGTVVVIGCVWYSYYKENTTGWLAIAISVTIVGVVLLLVLLVIRKSIALVVQLFKEAGKAIARMPQLFLQPFLTLLILGGITAGMLYVFLYIITARNMRIETTGYVSWNKDETVKGLLVLYLLGFLWLTQFVMGCQRLTISSAVAMWFFTREKSQLSRPVTTSIGRLIRYHIGSVAFGSLVIALVSLVRILLSAVQSVLSGSKNLVASFLFKCLGCCLWCFEKMLKFLTSQAYIQIAINGYSFCKAARTAFLIIVTNAMRVAAINSVGDFVLFLAKAGTVAITAVVGIQLFRDRTDIHYTWLPITVACVGAYFIAGCFFGLYEFVIDAIFLCFVEDCDRNDGLERPYFMSKGLMKFVKNASKSQNNSKKQ